VNEFSAWLTSATDEYEKNQWTQDSTTILFHSLEDILFRLSGGTMEGKSRIYKGIQLMQNLYTCMNMGYWYDEGQESSVESLLRDYEASKRNHQLTSDKEIEKESGEVHISNNEWHENNYSESTLETVEKKNKNNIDLSQLHGFRIFQRVLNVDNDQKIALSAMESITCQIEISLKERKEQKKLLTVLEMGPRYLAEYQQLLIGDMSMNAQINDEPMNNLHEARFHLPELETAITAFSNTPLVMLSSIALQRTAQLTLSLRKVFISSTNPNYDNIDIMVLVDRIKAHLESNLVKESGQIGTAELEMYSAAEVFLPLVIRILKKAICNGRIKGSLYPVESREFETTLLKRWIHRGEVLYERIVNKTTSSDRSDVYMLMRIINEAKLILELRNSFKYKDINAKQTLLRMPPSEDCIAIQYEEVIHARMIIKCHDMISRLKNFLFESML